jgi:hypothetical protein
LEQAIKIIRGAANLPSRDNFNPESDFINVGSGDLTLAQLRTMICKFGTEFPSFSIGAVGDGNQSTFLVCHYKQSITLDYAYPHFFDDLDCLIAHIKKHDDLSGFGGVKTHVALSGPPVAKIEFVDP